MVKNLTVKAGDITDTGLNPERDFLEEDMPTYSNILAWRIPRTEEPGHSP